MSKEEEKSATIHNKVKLNARGVMIEVPVDIMSKSTVFGALYAHQKPNVFDVNFESSIVHKFIDYLSGYEISNQEKQNIKNICDYFCVELKLDNNNIELVNEYCIQPKYKCLQFTYIYMYKKIPYMYVIETQTFTDFVSITSINITCLKKSEYDFSGLKNTYVAFKCINNKMGDCNDLHCTNCSFNYVKQIVYYINENIMKKIII